MASRRRNRGPLYVIEHMEKGLEDWCGLEYRHICSRLPAERVLFLNWPADVSPSQLLASPSAEESPVNSGTSQAVPRTMTESFEKLVQCGVGSSSDRSAGNCDGKEDTPVGATTGPQDSGILRSGGEDAKNEPASSGNGAVCGTERGNPLPPPERICLLDMDAEEVLQPEDVSNFDALVFGGILGNVFEREDGSFGSDDRTAELRKLGFKNRRHLGPLQMTTDTAVLVSHMVLEENRVLSDIPFVDSPDIEDKAASGGVGSDSVCMEGFRYVATRGADGEWGPLLPKGMRELLLNSADNDILDSL